MAYTWNDTTGQVTRITDGAKTQDLTYDAYGNVASEKTRMTHSKWGHGVRGDHLHPRLARPAHHRRAPRRRTEARPGKR